MNSIAPSEGHRYEGVKKLLEGLDNVHCYWDDILVHKRTWKEHLKVLHELFKRLAQASMTKRDSKCIFGVDNVDFLYRSPTAARFKRTSRG